jgi:hypothetical protein
MEWWKLTLFSVCGVMYTAGVWGVIIYSSEHRSTQKTHHLILWIRRHHVTAVYVTPKTLNNVNFHHSIIISSHSISFCTFIEKYIQILYVWQEPYRCVFNNTVIYLVNNTTYIGNQYEKFGDMFRFNWTIISPNTRHNTVTFNKCTHYGIPLNVPVLSLIFGLMMIQLFRVRH